jgi:hypothetical protein
MGKDAFYTAKSAVSHPPKTLDKAKSSFTKDSKFQQLHPSAQASSSEEGGHNDLHVPHEDAKFTVYKKRNLEAEYQAEKQLEEVINKLPFNV